MSCTLFQQFNKIEIENLIRTDCRSHESVEFVKMVPWRRSNKLRFNKFFCLLSSKSRFNAFIDVSKWRHPADSWNISFDVFPLFCCPSQGCKMEYENGGKIVKSDFFEIFQKSYNSVPSIIFCRTFSFSGNSWAAGSLSKSRLINWTNLS